MLYGDIQRDQYVDDNTPTISLLNNSEKRVQILHELSPQIFEGYEFVSIW